jgi:hypothetical protein
VAELTFFFDRCFGKGLPEAVRRADPPFVVEYFHDPKASIKFKHDAPDDTWIPVIAKQGWFILSHDNQWHKNEVEQLAVKQHAAGCFYLYGNNSLTWYKLRAFMRAVDKIIKLAGTTPRPFIFRAASNGRVTQIKL